jgi:DNA-binding transcriptional LysR family regulator
LTIQNSPQAPRSILFADRDQRVAAHKELRFARLREVSMSEVARHPIIAFSPEEYPSYQRLIADLLLPYTHAPQILPEYDNLESIIMAVEVGCGVAILYEDTSGIFSQRLVLRPLDPSPEPPPVVIAYRQEGLLTTVSGWKPQELQN